MEERDPVLAKEALPTLMKTAEIILATAPKNVNNATTVASLYILYANTFLDGEAFYIRDDNFELANELSIRAKSLYLRATALLTPFIEKKSSDFFSVQFELADPDKAASDRRIRALKNFQKKDVGLMYLSSASILAAFGSDPLDFETASKVPAAIVLMEKALELDPDYGAGMLHDLAFSVYSSMPMELGGDRNKALAEYEAVLRISNGKSGGTYLSYALAICVPDGDYEQFSALLEKTLALTPESAPDRALMNALAIRKANRLKADAYLYFDLSSSQERRTNP